MTARNDIPLTDPRVLALAKARQQLAHERMLLPTWDELTPDEQDGSLPAARSYLEAAVRAGLIGNAEPTQPSSDHSAVYLDQHDHLWSDYPTVPPGDDVLPMVWASEQAQSREDLADRGTTLRVIGWTK